MKANKLDVLNAQLQLCQAGKDICELAKQANSQGEIEIAEIFLNMSYTLKNMNDAIGTLFGTNEETAKKN